MAGLQVEVDTAFLHSVQWPLTLALALAGFAPLIKPWRWWRPGSGRRRTSGSASRSRSRSTPTRCSGTSRATIKVDVEAEKAKLPEWVVDHLGDANSPGRVFMVREELRLLVRLARDDGSWPQGACATSWSSFEAEEVAEAETALAGLHRPYRRRLRPAAGARRAAPKLAEVQKRHRQCEAKLVAAIGRMERLRDELGSTFAVYAGATTTSTGSATPASPG